MLQIRERLAFGKGTSGSLREVGQLRQCWMSGLFQEQLTIQTPRGCINQWLVVCVGGECVAFGLKTLTKKRPTAGRAQAVVEPQVDNCTCFSQGEPIRA